MLRLAGYRSSIAAEKRRRRRVLMDNGGLRRRRLKPSGAMEGKPSAKKKARTTTSPEEEAVPVAAASLLTDDLILEILSRLPARSVHRFKCVSPAWRDLIADPAHRKKLAHPLAGFLYNTYHMPDPRFYNFHFAKVSSAAAPPVDLSLSFLPPDEYWYVDQLDTCNGLLLCRAHMLPLLPGTRIRRLNPITSCAIRPPGGVSTSPLTPRCQPAVASSLAWLLIQQSRPISTFFSLSTASRRNTSQE
ncbi:hypothetical protein ACQJBY_017450 [Aegilops geniculata]